jgi:hypothetical protein
LQAVGEPVRPPRRQRNSERRPREYLTSAEVETLIVAAKKRGRYGHRDATMILPNSPLARTVMSMQIEAGFKVMLDVIAAAETRQAADMAHPKQVIEPRKPDGDVSRRSDLPLSPAIRAGDFVFVSGMAAIRSGDWRAGAHHGSGRDAADPDEHGRTARDERFIVR